MNNKVKIFISRTLKLLALAVPLICLIVFAQENLFFYKDHDTRRLEKFYEEEKDSLDVILMGASEVTNGYVPGYAYELYGFTSYMYAMDSNRGPMYTSQLKEVLKHQNPQVIVVEIMGFIYPPSWEVYDEERLRIYEESIPFSWNKVQTILEQPFENKISFFVPLIKYHSDLPTAHERLINLKEEKKELPDLKGVVSKPTIYQGEGDWGTAYDPATFDLHEDCRDSLIEFLEYCEAEKIENVVFVNFPRLLLDPSINSYIVAVDIVEEILNEYGHQLIDLYEESDLIGLDDKHDFGDKHHLNLYGQMKMTEYLGELLVDEYKVSPRPQTAENIEKWEKCVTDTRMHFQVVDAMCYKNMEWSVHEEMYEWISPAKILGEG